MADSLPHPSQSRNARKKAKKKAKKAAAHLAQGHSDNVQMPHDDNSDSDSDVPESATEPNAAASVAAAGLTAPTSATAVELSAEADSVVETETPVTPEASAPAPQDSGSEQSDPALETKSSLQISDVPAPTIPVELSVTETDPPVAAMRDAEELLLLKNQLQEEQLRRLQIEQELQSLKASPSKPSTIDDLLSPKVKQLEAELELANTNLSAVRARESALKQQVEDLQVEVEVLKEELTEETKRLRIAEIQARRVTVLEKQLAEMQELLDLEQTLGSSKSPVKTAVADSEEKREPASTHSVPPPETEHIGTNVMEPVAVIEPVMKAKDEAVSLSPAPNATVETEPVHTSVKPEEEASSKKVAERWAAASAQPNTQAEEKPKTPRKLDIADRWPAASAPASDTTERGHSQPLEEKPKVARKMDLADRWPAALATAAPDAPGQSQQEEKPKSARKMDLADRWPAAAAAATSATEVQPPEEKSKSTRKMDLADRWPAAASTQTAALEREAPERTKTQGKIDVSSRWPAASSSNASATSTKAGPVPREKATSVVKLDTEAVSRAYSDVRDDNTATNWAAFAHSDDGTRIGVLATGDDGLAGLLKTFKNDNRIYGFLRVITGDDLSKRAKFVLIVWAGQELSALRRARAATDKVILKEVVKEFSVEMSATSFDDVVEEQILAAVRKSSGADYNSGLREAK